MSQQIEPASDFVDRVADLTDEEIILRQWAEAFFGALEDDSTDPVKRRNRWTERWFRSQRWRG